MPPVKVLALRPERTPGDAARLLQGPEVILISASACCAKVKLALRTIMRCEQAKKVAARLV
jgi:hypothetical protein